MVWCTNSETQRLPITVTVCNVESRFRQPGYIPKATREETREREREERTSSFGSDKRLASREYLGATASTGWLFFHIGKMDGRSGRRDYRSANKETRDYLNLRAAILTRARRITDGAGGTKWKNCRLYYRSIITGINSIQVTRSGKSLREKYHFAVNTMPR